MTPNTTPRSLFVTQFWEGFSMAFLAWSPPPEPVISWSINSRRFARLVGWFHTPFFSWLLVIAVFGIGLAAGTSSFGPSSPLAWITGVLTAIPFALARTNLLVGWRVAAVLAAAVAITHFSASPGDGLVNLAAAVLPLYTFVVAATHDRPIGLWAWGVAVVIVSGVLTTPPGIIALFGGVAALISDTVRTRRMTARELTEERERLGAERSRRVSAEEQARMARELHDVVAHHMSIVAVRAETAPYRIDGLSPEARSEFSEVSTAARESLDEIRAVLNVLRGVEVPRIPQPDLDQVEELVAATRRAGADTELNVAGRRRPLRPAVELAAYRILQESLANVTRHAPGERAKVWIDYGENALGLMVSNSVSDDVGPPGNGLAGMQERAGALGGSVDASRRADGRFVVEATLPVEL